MKYYILEGHEPRPAEMLEWAKWHSTAEKIVAQDTFDVGDKKVFVSTVFLGMDHSWNGGPPLLFETMVFGGEYDQQQWRCSTWEQAVSQHKMALNKVLS
jgi:hypothetical protein